MPVAEVAERKWRVLASGPVRSIGEYEFKGWKIGGKTIDMVSRFTQWAGEHGFHHRITVSDGAGLELAAALPKKPGIDPLMTSLGRNMLAVVTWGHQVVVPGTKAGTAELPNEDLGPRRHRAQRSTGILYSGRRQLPLRPHPEKQ
jgi:hypothetical protein